MEKRFGDIVDSTLRHQHLIVDGASRRRLIAATERALTEAALTNLGKAQGDYSPDSYIDRFPDWDAPKPPAQPRKQSKSDLDLFKLLDHKFATQSKAVKTKEDYRRSLNDFVSVTGRISADTITKEDVRKWRDEMIIRGLSKKTINGKHLTALKAVLTHGVEEFNLSTNAAHGIQDKRDDKVPVGSKDYTLEQAETILNATFDGTGKALAPHYQRAIFWVPWICAYTGLRVSEVTQLRGRNVREEDGIPFFLITPEDGSTKSKRAWTVGVHKHLIELGLLDMFKAIGDGPAFYRAYPEGTDLTKLPKHRSKDSAERIGNWITHEVLGGSAPGGKPSHAWRHLATTRSRNFDVDKEARDYMMGSRSRVDAREGYGEWSPMVINREINKIGRFAVPDGDYRPTLEQLVPEGLRNERLKQRPSIRTRKT
ncbi:integrase [Phyllobacterium sp. CCNWLW109]